MKDMLIIIGASGHGKVVLDIANMMNLWKNIVFLDDDTTIKLCCGKDVIGTIKDIDKYKEVADFFVAVGNNKIRERIQEHLVIKNIEVTNLVHPSAIICENVQIGIGTVIMAGVVINSDSKIGKGCIINTSSSIDHDNIVNDYVHISPGVNIAGTVEVGTRSWLGIGSSISNNIKISSDCILGAGTVVIKDIIECGTYVGVPCHKVKGD